MNITVGFRAGVFFGSDGFILKLIIGEKNTHVFNFLSLFRAYGSQRYHCQSFVSPCHILLLYIGYSHKDNSFISKNSPVLVTNDYLKLARSVYNLLANTHSFLGLMQ